jgi:hypothetical protein
MQINVTKNKGRQMPSGKIIRQDCRCSVEEIENGWLVSCCIDYTIETKEKGMTYFDEHKKYYCENFKEVEIKIQEFMAKMSKGK